MNLPNHVAGGVVITGIFASISGVNIFTNPIYLAVAIASSVLPDIDHPKSPIGFLCYPLAKWINKTHGHRTITHSFLALATGTLAILIPERMLTGHGSYALIFFWGFISHLILDMVTKSGVYCFYPWVRNRPAVIPGNEDLRISTRNRKTELTVFVFFCFTAWFLTPLFQNGFWTSYNRLFGTMSHLGSEFRKSDDLLEVTYLYRIGSEEFTGKGYCINADNGKATLLDENNHFLHLDPNHMVIEQVLPYHTGRYWKVEQTNFINISTDSLNAIIQSKQIVETEILGNQQFATLHLNASAPHLAQRFKSEYITHLKVEAIQEEITREVVLKKESPRIKTLFKKIELARQENNRLQQQLTDHQAKIEEVKSKLQSATELYDQQRLSEQLQALESKTLPHPDLSRIPMLEAQIAELKQSDQNNYEKKLLDAERRYRDKLPEPVRLTGYFKYVEMAKGDLLLSGN